nr:MAG TPA: hypothetical protein [Microviridae sp.]
MSYVLLENNFFFFSSDIASLRHVCATCSKGSSSNNC